MNDQGNEAEKLKRYYKERKDIQKELASLKADIRRDSFKHQADDLAEDMEEKLREFEIKIIEYEDDLN